MAITLDVADPEAAGLTLDTDSPEVTPSVDLADPTEAGLSTAASPICGLLSENESSCGPAQFITEDLAFILVAEDGTPIYLPLPFAVSYG